MKLLAIISYFFLSVSGSIYSASQESHLSFPEVAARAQMAIEKFTQEPPTFSHGFYNLTQDTFTELRLDGISQENPITV